MKESCIILLMILIFCRKELLANPDSQFLLNSPSYTSSLIRENSDKLIHIQADQAEVIYADSAVRFFGNVDIKQGDITLSAEQVQLNQKENNNSKPIRTITAIGNVTYSSNEITLKGIKVLLNLNTRDAEIYQGNYQLVGRQGRGAAEIIKQCSDNRYTILKNGSFTSCLPGDHSWIIIGSKIIYDRQKQITEIWHAYFKIGKVPILYCPYLQIPMTNKLNSSFLIPHVKYNQSHGFQLNLPYSLNLSQGYDATFVLNYMSKRGPQIETEFSYFNLSGKGLVEFDWLPKDQLYKRSQCSSKNKNGNRWFLYWWHDGVIDTVWRVNIDYTKVSDCNYMRDLDREYGEMSTTDDYVIRKFDIGYSNERWELGLAYKQIQLFGVFLKNAYRVIPQVNISYYNDTVRPFYFKIFSQVSKFDNVNSDYPKATRFHIEPICRLAFTNLWGSLNTEIKLMATSYQQDNIDKYNNEISNSSFYLKHSVSRIIPQIKIKGKIMFERNFPSHYTQTLEPKLQYLYVSSRNHKNIGVYDSMILQTDYLGLFRDRSYSGLDYIPFANQIAIGITTHIYNNKKVERFNASLGQVYSFHQSSYDARSDVIGTILNRHHITHPVIWAGNSYWAMNNQWCMRANIQYNASINNLAVGNAILEYRYNKDRILKLDYRHVHSKYINSMIPESLNINDQNSVDQIGITGNFPMINHWSLFGAYFYNIKSNHPANQVVSVQYNTCCWAIKVGYKRSIIAWKNTDSSNKYDNKLLLHIELCGLKNNSNSKKHEWIDPEIMLPCHQDSHQEF